MLRPETRARARALQLLYAWETLGRPPFVDVIERVIPLIGSPADVVAIAQRLAAASVVHADQHDARIADLIEHWRLDRLGTIERCIFRLALTELDSDSVPPRVVIDEAVRLAHWFGGARAPGFVNGVLDAAARALGRL